MSWPSRATRRRLFSSLCAFNGTFSRFATNLRHRRPFPTPRNARENARLYFSRPLLQAVQLTELVNSPLLSLSRRGTIMTNFVIARVTHPVLLDDGGGAVAEGGRGGE